TDGFTHAGEAGISAPRHLYRRPRFVRRMNRRAAPRVRFTVIRTVFAFLATFPTQRTVMSRPAQRRRSLPLLILTILALLTTGATPASAAASTLTLDHATYTPGQNVVATYSTGQVSAKNWVGIYASDSTPGQVSSLVWAYAPDASGSVTLSTSSLSPGSYRAHFLYNDGYAQLAAPTPFAVTAAGPGSVNLIINGDAECGNPSASGYDGVTVPGWQATGLPSIVGYNTGNGFPSPSTAGPAIRGNQ